MKEFEPFGKIARLSRPIVVTEKIDGTNASIYIGEDGEFLTGSRTRWITPQDDNYGFSQWAHEHKEELLTLGPGHHFGEWWGRGIQRNYSQPEKRWSMFNTHRWCAHDAEPLIYASQDQKVAPKSQERLPTCCDIVPILYAGPFDEFGVMKGVKSAVAQLVAQGSAAAPGFMKPEGVIVYHADSLRLYKKTLDKDGEWKGKSV